MPYFYRCPKCGLIKPSSRKREGIQCACGQDMIFLPTWEDLDEMAKWPKLYKVYLVYGANTHPVMHLYWAKGKEHVLELMGWTEEDKPKPIIEEMPREGWGGILCHHIADSGLAERLIQEVEKGAKIL